MSGDLVRVWGRSWQEIWGRLSNSKVAPRDFYMEMVVGMIVAPRLPRAPLPFSEAAYDDNGELTDDDAIAARNGYDSAMQIYRAARDEYETAVSSSVSAESYFSNFHSQIRSERDAVQFLSKAYDVIEAMEDEALAVEYVRLVRNFIECYNLQYEMRDKFNLCPTIPGVFSRVISELKGIAAADPHLYQLMSEFEEAFSDLRAEKSQSKMKTCLHKQFNLLEAMGRKCPGVTAKTLGEICGQLSWPHVTIREVGVKLYGFRSDYPGLGHGGNPDGMLRELQMKDFVSLSLMLVSFAPYLAHNLDSDSCYEVGH